MPKLFELVLPIITLSGIGLSAIVIKNQIDASNNQPPIHGNERNSIVNHYQKHGLSVKSDNVHPNKKLNYDRYFAYFKLLGPGK
jgi:hypothetical protein